MFDFNLQKKSFFFFFFGFTFLPVYKGVVFFNSSHTACSEGKLFLRTCVLQYMYSLTGKSIVKILANSYYLIYILQVTPFNNSYFQAYVSFGENDSGFLYNVFNIHTYLTYGACIRLNKKKKKKRTKPVVTCSVP